MSSDSNLQKDLKRYKSEIKSKLLCNTKESKACFKNLQDEIDNYIVDNEVTSVDEIIKHFGTADDIANAFFANVDMKTVKRRITIKRLIAILVVAIIVIAGIGITIMINHVQNATGTYEVIIETIDESESIILEE